MSLLDDFERVSHDNPCRICDHPDWCLTARDGHAALCQRIESHRRWGDAGWFHRLGDSTAFRSARGRTRAFTIHHSPTGTREFARLAETYRTRKGEHLEDLAIRLGIRALSLVRLRICIVRFDAWFPMSDAENSVVGIRVRDQDGNKRALTGSRQGLFIPEDLSSILRDEQLLIAEGPTDTAALLDFGFHAIGRPSCTGAASETIRFVLRRDFRRIVLIADADESGRKGAEALATRLRPMCASLRIVTPPSGVKDAREWVRAGATRADVQREIDRAAEVGVWFSAVEVAP